MLNPAVCLRTLWPDLPRSDTCREGGRVSSEISESSDDDETGPLLTSMATARAVHTLEVSSIRSLTVLFIVGLD